MAGNQLPAFDRWLIGDDAPAKPQVGAIRGGLGSGFHELLGLGGSAVQGLGTIAGVDPVAAAGKSFAADQGRIAERVGRPDLEIAPWNAGGANVAPWLAYQAAKLVPTLAGFAVSGGAAPATEVGTFGARLLPEFLGGAAKNATAQELKASSKFLTGAAGFGGVTGFGQAVQSADQKPGGLTRSDALQAAAESPLYAAAGLLEPGFLRGALKGAEGKIATRVISRALSGSAVGTVQAGMLAALDTTFRPDLSSSDKMASIVDAAATGGAVGGALGGVTGLRSIKRAEPNQIDTDTLSSTVDQALDLGDQSQAQNLGRLGLPAPPTFVDAMGRAAPGSGGDDLLRATPRDSQPEPQIDIPQAAPSLFGPDAVADRSAVPGSTIVVGRRGERGMFTKDATGVEQPPVVPEDTSRAFRNLTDPELESYANALANKREAQGKLSQSHTDLAKAIDDEIAFRRGNNPLTSDGVVKPTEAVEQPANQRGTGEQDTAAPASPDDISARVTELTQGLRLPTSLKEKLATARSEHDVQDIIHDEVIVEGKSGKMRDALAQRAGLLDDEGRPTPLVDEVSARKTAPGEQAATPAADAAFQERWKADVAKTGQKDPAVRALKPANEDDARLQIYRALGEQGVKSDADGLEKIAQQYGILDESKQLTPTALELAKRDPIPVDEAKAVAKAQGYKGADVTKFVRGVQHQTGEREISQGMSGEAAHAGSLWAEEHNSVPKGALKKYDPSAYTGEVTEEQRALGKPVEVKQGEIPPEVRQGQLVNEAIDNTGLRPATHESEIAALKTMVRNGDIAGAMEGLRRVQRGEKLFEEPQRGEPQPFVGEKLVRGQPQLKGYIEGPGKETTKVAAERAIRTYELGRRVDAAHAEGSIDRRTRLSLINKLRQGKLGEVINAVGAPTGKIEGPIAAASNRAARRADLHRQLQDILAEHAREQEVPELNVDENGIIQAHPYRVGLDGKPQVNGTDRRAAAMLVSKVIDGATPKDIMRDLAERKYTWPWLGKMAAKFEKYVPDDVHMEVVSPQEMTEVLNGLGMAADEAGSTTQGLWSNTDRTIYISTGVFHPSVFMHEIAHSILASHIDRKTDIGKQLIQAFKELKPFLPKGDYSTVNAHEFMSEFLSRQQVRDWVQKIDDANPGNIFQRIWKAIRTALGRPPQSEVEKLLNLAEAAGSRPVSDALASSPLMMRVPELNEHVHSTVDSLVNAVDKQVDLEGRKGDLRRSQLYATTIHHITEFYGKWFDHTREDGSKVNGVVERERHIDFKEAIQQRHAQLIADALEPLYAIEHSDKASFKTINRLAQLSEYGIHPARPYDEQIKEVRENPALESVVAEANSLYRSLGTKGHLPIYDNLRKFNDILMLAQTALALHDHVSTDKVTAGRIDAFARNPMDRFMEEQAREGYGLKEAHDFWNRELDAQTGAINSHVKTYENTSQDKDMSSTERRMLAAGMNSLRNQVKAIGDMRERLEEVPNFHLGRDGDYFVDMKLKVGAGGKVDPEALAAAAEHLSQFGRVISPHFAPKNDQGHIFIRVDNTVAQRNLIEAAEKLQSKGIVRADHVDEKTLKKTPAIQSGKRTDDRIRNALANQWSNRLIEELNANEHIKPEDKKMLENMILSQALDLTPDNTLAKLMTHRENVPGYDADMIRSYNVRAKTSVDALAGMAVARKLTDAYTNMRTAIRDVQGKRQSEVPIAQRNGMTDIVDELSKRDKEFADMPRGSKALNQLQAISGAFFLSANLAYPAVNLVQVPMVALPELGSRFGFLKTARAMASVTPEALKIIGAIYKTGRAVSISRAADAVLTTRALKAAGISGRKVEFIMQVANRGGFDIGGPSRELARNAQGLRGDKLDQGLRMASAMGYYSETLSRLVVGLAEFQLHPNDAKIDDMAQSTVRTLKESMWDYSSPNTARMLGRNGFAGKLTPLTTQFMKYTAMLNEKLYREVHAALGGDAEARRFLAGHLAMTTVFAGTLGLPFASVFASTYDRLKDLFDAGDQPSDIQASYRGFLSDMLGKGAAEIIARGTPRAAGVDLSTRVGEQDILPFSKFIADRRDFKDKMKDLESRSWGAPTSMMASIVAGGGRVAQGDIIGGLRQMLPLGLSGMVKSYQMSTQGYTDSKGNVLPMDPSARDILAQAIGFNPAQNAEYNEARSDQMQRQGLLTRRAAQMRSQIVDAVTKGDHDRARSLIDQAIEFDKANPAFGVLRGVEGSIKGRRQAQAISQRFDTPLGISPKDTFAPRLTRYADVEYRAQ